MKRLNAVLKLSIAVLSLSSFNAFAQNNCETLSGCAKKQCNITQEIEQAKFYNNNDRVKGLTIALNQSIKYCTTDGLKQELMNDIVESENDIAEYKIDLQQAQLRDDSDKVKRYQDKISAEEAKRARFIEELNELQ